MIGSQMSANDPSSPAKKGQGARRWRRRARLLGEPKRMWREHRGPTLLLVAAAVVLLVGVVVGYELLKRPPDVHNASVAFKPQKPPKPKAKTVNWPMFGLNPARTRYLPAKGVKPPFRLLWHYTERPLARVPAGLCRTADSTRSTTAAPPLRLTPTPARCSGSAVSAGSTPPLRPSTRTAFTSSTSSPVMWSSWTRRPAR